MSLTLTAQSAQTKYLPEENPFQTLIVDVTHQCNMTCKNCYIPNREIPDMNLDWLCSILARLPRRTRIRIVGAEATTRKDLPEIIKRVRRLGHTPLLLTNGLKIANHSYLKTLKQAGLRTVYLSFNGGFNDQVYQAIDNLDCANLKRRALENLISENMYISLGMILVRGINEPQLRNVFSYSKTIRQIYELKVRSVGLLGRHMDTTPFVLEEMIQLFAEVSGIEESWIHAQRSHSTGSHSTGSHSTGSHSTEVDFRIDRLRVQLTQWPDLGSPHLGRLAPDGTLQPFCEHVLANEGGY